MPMNCSKYNVDVRDIYLKLVPYFWRIMPETSVERTKWINYLEVVAGSLENAQGEIFDLCVALKDFLDVTGQHLSLENYLNNLYDNISRRIFITENEGAGAESWYLEGEADPDNKVWYLEGETDPIPKTWYLQSEIANLTFNFTINIPAVVVFDETILRDLLDNYVQAVSTYNIVTF